MPPTSLQRLRFKLAILVFFVLITAVKLVAAELIYLPLKKEGQASIAIDEKKKASYIVDLGRGGDGDTLTLDGVPLLDRLEQKGIQDLYFVCSHPHSDHVGGIRALFLKPEVFFRDQARTNPRFKSISVIDDGIRDSLFPLLQEKLTNNTQIKITHYPARNKNAFEGISNRLDDVSIETIPYPVTGKSAHGRAVITLIRLGKHSILDTDDADSPTVRKVVAYLRRRGDTVTTIVVPHHASRYHDITPLFTLKPKYALISVNPLNRYGHPSPPVLRRLMEELGKSNVLFTGSVENVVLDENGIKSALYTAANKESYPMFVAANRVRAEKRRNKNDIADCVWIQKMMNDDTVQPSRTRLIAEVKVRATILPPDFEYGAVAYGSDGIATLQNHKIFSNHAVMARDLTGQDVAVVLERTDSGALATGNKLTTSEAQRVIQQLYLLGPNADRAKRVYVYFSSPTGFIDVVHSVLLTNPMELSGMAQPKVAPPPSRPQPPPQKPGQPSPQGPPRQPSPQVVTVSAKLPPGGMVFLRGDKLVPIGKASEILGGTLGICGENFCVKTPGDQASQNYILPFSPGPLFSEVWTRVITDRIDSFYLSINPTKQFLRNIDINKIPSGQLQFGSGAPGVGIRTHEVVTAGKIENSQIGKILWEADVAFKSQSLGYNVLTGTKDVFVGSASALTQQESSRDMQSLAIPFRERWCRLYWTSGAQSIEVDSGTNRVYLKGDAVVARSEPMIMRNGSLVERPSGTWCGASKSVAAALSKQANSRRARLTVLNQLRDLAEIQSFVKWARDNGLVPEPEFLKAIAQHSPTQANVPTWTSGVKDVSTGRLRVQLRRRVTGSKLVSVVHVSVPDDSFVYSCVLPFWQARESEFPENGINKDFSGVWRIPPGKYQFVDAWMAALAKKISDCSNGDLLQPITLGQSEGIDNSLQGGTDKFGITFHPQAITSYMHGGVLLGAQLGFLEGAVKSGLLLSPSRRPFFQNENGKLHFWRFEDNDPQYGVFAQHVVIDGGTVEESSTTGGQLRFVVKTNPGAIVRQELRASRAKRFPKGVEWIGSRHASDGSWIWEKAVAKCDKVEDKPSDCVEISSASLETIGSSERDTDRTIIVSQVDDNHWEVILDISSIGSNLDQRWKEASADNLNQRISLIFDYAKWGFIRKALQRYQEVSAQIEGDTKDTILLRLLEGASRR